MVNNVNIVHIVASSGLLLVRILIKCLSLYECSFAALYLNTFGRSPAERAARLDAVSPVVVNGIHIVHTGRSRGKGFV